MTTTKPILIAGVLGGLLGGVVSFAATRWLKPAEPTKAEVPAEARQVAQGFGAKLKAGKYDDFLTDVKSAMVFDGENDFRAFQKSFEESRNLFPKVYGTPLGELELVRETALTPNLVRFVYLEKFPRGALAWVFILYKDAERWQLNYLTWNKSLGGIFPDRP